jgi:hypothetical protein
MEPPVRVSLGRPVKHMLQRADPVPTDSRQGGPSRISSTHRSGPFSVRVNEAAALPITAGCVVLRLDRYYGRLRLPPGTPPTSRLHTGYRTALVGGHREPASAGEGLPSSRRHLLNVPRPLRRGVPRGCISRIFTASMAFTVNNAARLSLNVYRRGRLRLHCGPLSCSHHRGFRRWASARPVSRPHRQPATGLPGDYPGRTFTGWRRRASDQVITAGQSPPDRWAHQLEY